MKKEQTYSSYLQIDKLLSSQKPLSENQHDELLFIIIHQVYELWFKQILHEATYLTSALNNMDPVTAQSTLGRILKILKTLVSQLDIIETMTPMSFSSFRDRLDSSSGLQSAQFRIFEFTLGNKNQRMIDIHKDNKDVFDHLTQLYTAPTLYDAFLTFLGKHDGFKLPDEISNRDYSQPPQANEELQKEIYKLYKSKSPLSLLCETFIDLDEGIQEWRYRHVKMVERTIGSKPGTGGSLGAQYLKKTLFNPSFPDLWDVRSLF